MTNIYAHISDGDAPKTQQVTEVSFVDENGKHVDIGGGGTTEIHTDATLDGTGTTGNPLKLSDDTNSKIAKAGTLTEDNLQFEDNIATSNVLTVGVCKNAGGNLSVMVLPNKGLSRGALYAGGFDILTVPALPKIAAISTLDSSAGLTDVINKVNEILKAVKENL